MRIIDLGELSALAPLTLIPNPLWGVLLSASNAMQVPTTGEESELLVDQGHEAEVQSPQVKRVVSIEVLPGLHV